MDLLEVMKDLKRSRDNLVYIDKNYFKDTSNPIDADMDVKIIEAILSIDRAMDILYGIDRAVGMSRKKEIELIEEKDEFDGQ